MLGSLASLGSLVRMSGILHERGKSIPALPYSLTAILADPYLSTFPDCSVRSCLYMVDLIMITAPHDQTPIIPTTPPTLLAWLRQLEAAARVPS